jgi:isocitrate lyase
MDSNAVRVRPMNGQAAALEREWATSERWKGVERTYTAEDVLRLRGTVLVEHTLARMGAERLWNLIHTEPFVPSLGALTGNQAMQQVKAGLKAIYVSGWQVAADANVAGHMYPDQSLYPANSVPMLVRRINQALQRADQIHHAEGTNGQSPYWFAPVVADAEAGFGGAFLHEAARFHARGRAELPCRHTEEHCQNNR